MVSGAGEEVGVAPAATGPDGQEGVRPWPAALFPTAPPSSCPVAVRTAGYAGGLGTIVVLALLRQPGVAATKTLWAEDGVIFYAQALSKSVLGSLMTAYNGYDQLVPRLAVQVARAAPVPDAAATIAVVGALGLAALGCLVFHMARGHIPSAALRALLVAAMVLLPVANFEMLDNLVNLPWWLFFAAFWALLWRPRGVGGAAVAALLCGLAAASEPLVALLLPLAAVRVVVLRRPRELAAVAGLAAGLVFQSVVVLRTTSGHSYPATGLSHVPADFAVRVGLGWLTGRRGTAALLSWDRPVTDVLGLVVLAGVLAAALKLGSRRVRALTVAAGALAPLCFAIPVWLRGAAPLMSAGTSDFTIGFAGRYAATPILMVLSVVLALVGHLSAGRSTSRPRPPHAVYRPLWAATAVCALLLPAWVADFRDRNARMDGPTWQSQLGAADAQCRRWNSDGLARVAVSPLGDSFVLHCRVLGLAATELDRRPALGGAERPRTLADRPPAVSCGAPPAPWPPGPSGSQRPVVQRPVGHAPVMMQPPPILLAASSSGSVRPSSSQLNSAAPLAISAMYTTACASSIRPTK